MNNPVSTNQTNKVQINTNTNPLQKYNKLYYIFAILGGIVLFITSFNLVATVFGVFLGLGLAWLIISTIASSKIIKLNFKNYSLPEGIKEKQLFEYLKLSALNPDLQIDKGFIGIKFVYKNITKHTIYLNENKNTYSISSTMTIKSKLKNGGKVNSIKLYTYTIQAIPIIQNVISEAAISMK